MRRPSSVEVRSSSLIGPIVMDVLDAMGVVMEGLPQIIPDDVSGEAFEQMITDYLKSKGWPDAE